MNHSISLKDVLKTVDTAQGPCDVCCSAEGSYHEEDGHLHLDLDAWLCPGDIRQPERRLGAAWLPKPVRLSEGVDPFEASDLAKEIFGGWIQKVRAAIPSTMKVPIEL
jgi:hypothetical protein